MSKNKQDTAYLKRVYYSPAHPGSFGGINALERIARGKNISRASILKFLSGEEAYNLHRPIRHHFERRRIVVSDIDEQWEADLIDVSSISRQNRGYRFMLTAIDTLSKTGWAEPIRNKTSHEIIRAFKKIFKESKRLPEKLRTDKGKEFTNRNVQAFLKKHNIHFFSTQNSTKAAICERFNRTIKTKLYRYFTYKNTHAYLPVLKDILHAYNNTFHRSIKRKPSEVNNANARDVWRTLYLKRSTKRPRKSDRFKIGDTVRVTRLKFLFEKGYTKNWSGEIFTIKRRVIGSPPLYIIKDHAGEQIEGTFYEDELQKVSVENDKLYQIERIVSERGKGKRKEYLVKYLDYPSKFNEWISRSQIERV